MLFGELAYLRGRIDLVRLVEDTVQVPGVADHAPGPGTHPLTAQLLGLLGTTRWQRGDLDGALAQARHAMAIAAAIGEPAAARYGLEVLANALSFRGDMTGALQHASRAGELAGQVDDVELQVLSVVDLTLWSAYTGDDAAAGRFEARMTDAQKRLDSPTARAFVAYAQGERRAEKGHPDAAGHLEIAIRRPRRWTPASWPGSRATRC